MLEVYRRMVFNVLPHNRDDHVKNFAFGMDDDGAWHLAPAHDIVFSTGPGGDHTMTVAGEGRAPSQQHFLHLAAEVGISDQDAAQIVADVAAAARRWPVHARTADVNARSTRAIQRAIGECLARLGRE